MPPKLLLASQSPYRRQLIDRLGVAYECHGHLCDERSIPVLHDRRQHALQLARKKAESLRANFPEHYILGSDQIAELDGEILHKPGNFSRAKRQLTALSGKEHRLLTAYAILSPSGQRWEHCEEHRMRIRPLDEEEITRYLEAEKPYDCCGSYKIEGGGIALFEAISGQDHTAIIGLPLMKLSSSLRQIGFALP